MSLFGYTNPDILSRHQKEIKDEFPDQKGFSSRNLKYMRKFASEYMDIQFVQQVVAQIPWSHNVILMDKVNDISLKASMIENFKNSSQWKLLEENFPGTKILDIVHKDAV
jgi:predicted nuclease of restriction endonuclease-like (RecB) superfamily